MPENPWTLIGLLAFSVAATLATRGSVARLQRPGARIARSIAAVAADLIWIVLVFASGFIAARYIERLTQPLAVIGGWLLFGLFALGLSLLRARLYQQSTAQVKGGPSASTEERIREGTRALIYVLFPICLYLALALVLNSPADPMLFIPLGIGALLPDLDAQRSPAGRLVPSLSRRLEGRLGEGGAWHSLVAVVFVALVTAPLVLFIDLRGWVAIPLGFLSHLLLDLFRPRGVLLFWPVTPTRYHLFGGLLGNSGGPTERRFALSLVAVAAILLLVADLGPPPAPAVAAPTYEQSMERYRSIQGRNLALAEVSGSWQATGRPVNARFEILSASGPSFVMHDRFSGKVFTAGRSATDNLYLNRIRVLSGAPARVKAVEIELEDQLLVDATPVLYEMQREPGVEHIFVSGDIIVPAEQDVARPALSVDYAQTSLRRIQSPEPGHYRLQYLTASDLIGLGTVGVERADLVIVATYTETENGPTATPLPSPPATPTIHTGTGEGVSGTTP